MYGYASQEKLKFLAPQKSVVFTATLIGFVYALSINTIYYTQYTVGAIELARNILNLNPFVNPWFCSIGLSDFVEVRGKCVFAGPLGLGIVLAIPIRLADALRVKDLVFGGFAMAFFGTLTFLISIELFRTILKDEKKSLILSIVNGLAGPLYIYSTHIFPQAPLAFFYTLHTLSLLKLVTENNLRWVFVAGFSASMAMLLDPSMFISITVVFLATLVWLCLNELNIGKGVYKTLKYAFLYTLSAAPMTLIQLLYNLYTTGNVFTFPEQLYIEKIGVNGFELSNIPHGLLIQLIDTRKSLLSLYPIYIFSLLAMPKMLKAVNKYENLLLLLSTITPIIVYSSWYDADGGLSYGPRFLTTITPLLIIPIGIVLKKKRVSIALATLSIYSFTQNIVVVTSTPYPSTLEDMKPLENQFITALNKFLKGFRSSLIYNILFSCLGSVDATTMSILILVLLAATSMLAAIKNSKTID
ncbi:hypothetical protein QPL79_05125 [Ignisphaera sp. 4213-co]|uniref:Glycosyltransferase RgtA/B/C/D-like domain-containing protein n=1 Tax=Ignisphaera cupida TaxID=3050454 RepID=A0ABD4Z744_9CREN|nr:hypothetical protein [Ignisphaera sp. 4213-co]MDK6028738.1 hypothetical protein [Ignisphaera sp. 4213-co]